MVFWPATVFNIILITSYKMQANFFFVYKPIINLYIFFLVLKLVEHIENATPRKQARHLIRVAPHSCCRLRMISK